MIKLTQLNSGKPFGFVYVSLRHIVAIFPDRKGNGCYLELTSSHAEDPLLHVSVDPQELADIINKGDGV